MPRFVNYKKRGFTLPPGCKDLIDVLAHAPSRRRRKAHVAAGGFQPLEIKEERFSAAGLAEIGRYVSRLLHWRGERFTLSITTVDFEYPVTMCRNRGENTIVLLTREAHREHDIRTFFDRQGIGLLWDYPPSEFGQGDGVRGLVYPLPAEEARAISLTSELLRSVFGLTEDAGLEFRHYELETGA